MTLISRLIKITIRIFVFAILLLVLGLTTFIIGLTFFHNQPMKLPVPTGTYSVGRNELNWVDLNRDDPLADTGNLNRELAIWIWYPADQRGTTPAPYLPPSWVQAREKDQGAGILIENDFSRIQTNSYEGLPVASTPKTFPVLIMEPGMGPMATDYSVFAENLASHGYIVVGINPTYTSNWTVFLDGRVAPRSIKGTIPDADSPAAADADANRIEAVWVQDVVFVMDQLAKINTDSTSSYYGRLDLEHMGVWGHSFGGVAAISVCQQDPRCKAGVDMDGTPTSNDEKLSVPQPFMFLTEDYSKGCDRNCDLMQRVYLNTKPGAAFTISIAGTRHFNFSDLPLRQTIMTRPIFAAAGYEGSIQPDRALHIANAYLTVFFDQSLKGIQTGLLQGPSSNYLEVTFEKR